MMLTLFMLGFLQQLTLGTKHRLSLKNKAALKHKLRSKSKIVAEDVAGNHLI